jgi:hypothetical protein
MTVRHSLPVMAVKSRPFFEKIDELRARCMTRQTDI